MTRNDLAVSAVQRESEHEAEDSARYPTLHCTSNSSPYGACDGVAAPLEPPGTGAHESTFGSADVYAGHATGTHCPACTGVSSQSLQRKRCWYFEEALHATGLAGSEPATHRKPGRHPRTTEALAGTGAVGSVLGSRVVAVATETDAAEHACVLPQPQTRGMHVVVAPSTSPESEHVALKDVAHGTAPACAEDAELMYPGAHLISITSPKRMLVGSDAFKPGAQDAFCHGPLVEALKKETLRTPPAGAA